MLTFCRRHVFEDLRPYVCTYQACDVKLYADRDQWFEHELHHHRLRWQCAFCAKAPYNSTKALHHHLNSVHANLVSPTNIDALTQASKTVQDSFAADSCPFCTEWEQKLRESNTQISKDETLAVTAKQFQKHLARHMEQLALFAIPRGHNEIDEGDSGDVMAGSTVAISETSTGSLETPVTNEKLSRFESLLKADLYEHAVQFINDLENDLELDQLNQMLHLAVAGAEEERIVLAKALITKGADPNSTLGLKRKTPSHLAAAFANSDMLRELNFLGARGTTTNTAERTLLHEAASHGRSENVTFLLNNEASIFDRDVDRCTPLHLAAQNGHVTVIQMLCEAGGPVDLTEEYCRTPLHLACQEGHVEAVDVLLEYGSDVNGTNDEGDTPLHLAVSGNNQALVDMLLKRGASVNAANLVDLTPLHCAAEYNHVAIVEMLLTAGAYIESTGRSGWTPLHLACHEGHEGVVDILLKHGSEFNVGDQKGDTPLHLAIPRDNMMIAEMLVSSGANLNVGNFENLTPLHTAAKIGVDEMMTRFLLDHGSPSMSRDKNGDVPLHLAAESGHATTAALLIRHTSSLEPVNNTGWTPLLKAANNLHLSTVKELINYGTSISNPDNVTQTAFLKAVSSGLNNAIKVLCQHGANTNLIDQSQWSPLLHAAMDQNQEGVKLLIDHGASFKVWRDAFPQISSADITRAEKMLAMDFLVGIFRSLGRQTEADEVQLAINQEQGGSYHGVEHPYFSGNRNRSMPVRTSTKGDNLTNEQQAELVYRRGEFQHPPEYEYWSDLEEQQLLLVSERKDEYGEDDHRYLRSLDMLGALYQDWALTLLQHTVDVIDEGPLYPLPTSVNVTNLGEVLRKMLNTALQLYLRNREPRAMELVKDAGAYCSKLEPAFAASIHLGSIKKADPEGTVTNSKALFAIAELLRQRGHVNESRSAKAKATITDLTGSGTISDDYRLEALFDYTALDPDQIYLRLGSVCLRDKDFDRAEECFKKLVAESHSNSFDSKLVLTAYIKLGEVCLIRNEFNWNDLDKAMMYFFKAIDLIAEQSGEDSEPYHEASLLLAMVCFRKGLREQAEVWLKKAPHYLDKRTRNPILDISAEFFQQVIFYVSEKASESKSPGFLSPQNRETADFTSNAMVHIPERAIARPSSPRLRENPQQHEGTAGLAYEPSAQGNVESRLQQLPIEQMRSYTPSPILEGGHDLGRVSTALTEVSESPDHRGNRSDSLKEELKAIAMDRMARTASIDQLNQALRQAMENFNLTRDSSIVGESRRAAVVALWKMICKSKSFIMDEEQVGLLNLYGKDLAEEPCLTIAQRAVAMYWDRRHNIYTEISHAIEDEREKIEAQMRGQLDQQPLLLEAEEMYELEAPHSKDMTGALEPISSLTQTNWRVLEARKARLRTHLTNIDRPNTIYTTELDREAKEDLWFILRNDDGYEMSTEEFRIFEKFKNLADDTDVLDEEIIQKARTRHWSKLRLENGAEDINVTTSQLHHIIIVAKVLRMRSKMERLLSGFLLTFIVSSRHTYRYVSNVGFQDFR